jgi:hypothetical protein
MSTARETYSALRNFCIDIGAIRARIEKVFDSTIFYTVSYTYTFFSGNSLALSGVCDLPNATQNQVVETSCWLESPPSPSTFGPLVMWWRAPAAGIAVPFGGASETAKIGLRCCSA